jgi:hypothetical protein
VADISLHGALCRQRPEEWLTVGYMKLCVDKDMTVGDSWLPEAVCRQRPELWPTVGYMKLCVDRDLNSGQYLFLLS